MNASDLLDCALSAARTAGRHALDNFARRTEVLSTLRHDVKLKLDVECQGVADRVIRARFPSHTILGEEDAHGTTAEPQCEAYRWIIDPIDGTVNFSHGAPDWCCSVAVERAGIPLAGAVYAPVYDLCYSAAAESASACNGRAIRVSKTHDLAAAVVRTGVDKSDSTDLPSFEILRRITLAVQRPRIVGSAALDICRVAAGEADGYFEGGIYLWDIAAARLIVQQAGGEAEILRRLPQPHRMSFLATNALIHAALKRVILGD